MRDIAGALSAPREALRVAVFSSAYTLMRVGDARDMLTIDYRHTITRADECYHLRVNIVTRCHDERPITP